MKNYLLEIGTEELPTDSLDLIESHLGIQLEKRLLDARVSYGKMSFALTPRRIAIFIKGIAEKQEDQNAEWTGPAWDRAFDQNGKPTPALLGFLKSKNLKETDAQKKETPKGAYVFAQAVLRGQKVDKILPDVIKETLQSFAFARRMRWDATNFAFPRPIRWIVSLLDSKVIPFSLGNVKADRFTFGHRFLSPKKISLRNADEKAFRQAMKKAYVILDLEERKEKIRRELKAKKLSSKFDEDLIHLTGQLVEFPFLISGSFDPSFLKLPADVLSTSMKKHQKIFAVYDPKGKLKPQFVAVMNGKRSGLPKIVNDYRGVLEAKLRDAQFFYTEDTKEPLEKKVPRLKDIVFLGKLGTVHDKVTRLLQLSDWLSKEMKFSSAEANHLRRAAFLSKADLLTHMVFEFPELQGVMGREYALAGGEPKEVALAVSDHYLPRNLAQGYEELAAEQSRIGSFLAILDKIDTLAGAFGIGLEPSGSQDPYALRRAAGGVVKIIRAFGHSVDLAALIREAAKLHGERLGKKPDEVVQGLETFLKERVAFELGVSPGSKDDQLLKAVLRTSWSDLSGVFKRFDALKRSWAESPRDFLNAQKVIERTHNILKGAKSAPGDVKKDLLKEPLEQKLFELADGRASEVSSLVDRGEYGRATVVYGEIFHGTIHDFFEKVLVNVDDQAVRANRQALMRLINQIYVARIADLSVILPDLSENLQGKQAVRKAAVGRS